MYFEIDDYNALEQALHQLCVRLEAAQAPEQAVFDSKLVACELLSNVLQHGGQRAYFSLCWKGILCAYAYGATTVTVRPKKRFVPM